jgi:hypothetical protein
MMTPRLQPLRGPAENLCGFLFSRMRLPLATPMGPPIARIMGPGGSLTTGSVDATTKAWRRARRLRQEPEASVV